jgi:hypothetical protein
VAIVLFLWLQELARPLNDNCEAGTALATLPIAIPASTAGAFTDFELETCGIPAASRGVWFSRTGSDKITTATVTASSFNSKIAVFSGSCAFLTCIGSNDGPFVVTSSLTFMAKAGNTYHILLSGAKSFEDAGTYNLLISVRSTIKKESP